MGTVAQEKLNVTESRLCFPCQNELTYLRSCMKSELQFWDQKCGNQIIEIDLNGATALNFENIPKFLGLNVLHQAEFGNLEWQAILKSAMKGLEKPNEKDRKVKWSPRPLQKVLLCPDRCIRTVKPCIASSSVCMHCERLSLSNAIWALYNFLQELCLAFAAHKIWTFPWDLNWFPRRGGIFLKAILCAPLQSRVYPLSKVH